MSPENLNEEMSLSERLEKWFESPEGKASIERMKDEHRREENAKMRFADRVLRMDRPEIDHWMNKIISYYNSDKYIDKWYNRNIFPPKPLFDMIYEFIENHGIQVGENEYGYPVMQYMSWKVDGVYGQGQMDYYFAHTEEIAHEFGENIFYRISHNSKGPVTINTFDNVIVKSWDDAVSVIEDFCEYCKERNLNVDRNDFEIVKVELSPLDETMKKVRAWVYNT